MFKVPRFRNDRTRFARVATKSSATHAVQGPSRSPPKTLRKAASLDSRFHKIPNRNIAFNADIYHYRSYYGVRFFPNPPSQLTIVVQFASDHAPVYGT